MTKPGIFTRIGARLSAWRRPFLAVVLVAVVSLAFGAWRVREQQMEARLMATPREEVTRHKDLVKFAARQAKPLFAKHCAECHGADLKGRLGSGTPNLTDHVWLYGDGVFRIERDILYGVRSGHQKSMDIAEMRAYGLRGQLNEADIRNLVQYVIRLSGRPADPEAAALGREIYFKALCDDCHSGDGRGNIDYGATDLTANTWDYGGDPQSLYESIYYGRHGIMPAFVGKLSLTQIRALAVYVQTASQR